MNKKIWLIVLVVVVVVGAITYLLIERQNKVTTPMVGAFDPLSATYLIENESVTLVNGKAQTPAAPGSAEQVETSVFSQPAVGDLNGDGRSDAAMIITQESGGSGTFYYVVAAIDTASGTVGTNAVFLGDRIAPENIAIQNGQVVVNYADRNPGEPMSTPPSVGVTKYFSLNSSTLQEATPVAGAGQHCGGNMTTAAVCATGYHCAPAPGSHLPFGDVGGTCVAN
jgi:hypothetical protein